MAFPAGDSCTRGITGALWSLGLPYENVACPLHPVMADEGSVICSVTLTLANGCNPTTSFAQAFQYASSNDIHSHDK